MATFVSPDWVAERIGQAGYLVIDPRSAMRYLMGHLRSAVSVPYKKLQAPDGRLGPPAQLAAAFGDVGLGDDVTPILYDHQDGRNAAMAAWVLEYLGRTDVHIMDLRYEAWKDAGREVLYRPVLAASATFTARVNPAIRASLDDVANAGSSILVDARSPEEYRGEFEADHRPGRIPGAISLPHSELVGADANLYADQDSLRERLAGAGIAEGEPVIAYCRSGVRASVTWLALAQLGHTVALYDGSYAEWMDSDQPVET